MSDDNYSEDFKREAVWMFESGTKSVATVVHQTGITEKQLRAWQKRYGILHYGSSQFAVYWTVVAILATVIMGFDSGMVLFWVYCYLSKLIASWFARRTLSTLTGWIATFWLTLFGVCYLYTLLLFAAAFLMRTNLT